MDGHAMAAMSVHQVGNVPDILRPGEYVQSGAKDRKISPAEADAVGLAGDAIQEVLDIWVEPEASPRDIKVCVRKEVIVEVSPGFMREQGLYVAFYVAGQRMVCNLVCLRSIKACGKVDAGSAYPVDGVNASGNDRAILIEAHHVVEAPGTLPHIVGVKSTHKPVSDRPMFSQLLWRYRSRHPKKAGDVDEADVGIVLLRKNMVLVFPGDVSFVPNNKRVLILSVPIDGAVHRPVSFDQLFVTSYVGVSLRQTHNRASSRRLNRKCRIEGDCRHTDATAMICGAVGGGTYHGMTASAAGF
jgi:hypothetical protein